MFSANRLDRFWQFCRELDFLTQCAKCDNLKMKRAFMRFLKLSANTVCRLPNYHHQRKTGGVFLQQIVSK